MSRNRSWSFLGMTTALILASAVRGQAPDEHRIEPWADPGLNVTRDLALWLDAGRIEKARQAQGLPPLSDGRPLDVWHDASHVETADGWPSAAQRETADVIVLYSNNPAWNGETAAQLDRFLARGGGLVLIHYAVDGHQDVEALADRIGLAWRGGRSKFRHGPLDVDLSATDHPIARGFKTLSLVDESYWDLIGDPDSVRVLGTGVEENGPRPLFWVRQAGAGRVFVSIPGHYTWTFDDPLFRVLILRGMAWVAGEPVDRFNALVPLGARLRD